MTLLQSAHRRLARSIAAFLFVHHPNKSAGRKAMLRSAGSIGIAASARSMMVIGKDPADPTARVIAQVKGNLGAALSSMKFHFVQDPRSREPRIQRDGPAEGITADSLAQNITAAEGAQELAARFLRPNTIRRTCALNSSGGPGSSKRDHKGDVYPRQACANAIRENRSNRCRRLGNISE